MNILLANQPIRFSPLKFRGVQIILYQLHRTLLSAFFLLNFFYASRGSGHETRLKLVSRVSLEVGVARELIDFVRNFRRTNEIAESVISRARAVLKMAAHKVGEIILDEYTIAVALSALISLI